MKKFKLASIIALLFIFIASIGLAEAQSITIAKKSIIIDGTSKSVNIVSIDLNNPLIELDVVVSNDVIGGDESFSAILQRTKADAAINANFFDAYTSLEPFGTIKKDGATIYMEGKNTSMGIAYGNKVYFDRFTSVLRGYLDGKKKNEWNNNTQSMDFYLFDVWYVNCLANDPTGVYMYTPLRGASVQAEGGTAVEVINNKITQVLKNQQNISVPNNGYVIYYGSQAADEAFIDARFKIGRTVELSLESFYTAQVETTNTETAEAPTEPIKLYGCVDKTTNNYWDNEKNGMDFNLFNLWYINTNPIDSTGVYLYTPEKGSSLAVPIGTAIIVKDGKVSSILYDTTSFEIPSAGYVIYFGSDAADENYVSQRFEIGKTVDFYHPDTLKLDTENIIKDAVSKNKAALVESIIQPATPNSMPLNSVEDLISAGPYLVKNGEIIVNAEEEGFKEDKITKNRAQRSAIGITADNQLLMITVDSANMEELANIMLHLGAVEAMNLDGGASSGLYANSQTLTTPGRRLSTVLAAYDHSTNTSNPEKTRQFIEKSIKSNRFNSINTVNRIETALIKYTTEKFSDVKSGDWFSRDVSRLVGMNIIGGDGTNTFGPRNNINADAFIKMIITSLGYNLSNGSEYWASTYIAKAEELGLIERDELEVYNRPITRGEVSRIISRALKEEPSLSYTELKGKITDINDIEAVMQQYVLKVYGLGILTGYEDNSFKANRTLSRAEAATVLIRILDKGSRKSVSGN